MENLNRRQTVAVIIFTLLVGLFFGLGIFSCMDSASRRAAAKARPPIVAPPSRTTDGSLTQTMSNGGREVTVFYKDGSQERFCYNKEGQLTYVQSMSTSVLLSGGTSYRYRKDGTLESTDEKLVNCGSAGKEVRYMADGKTPYKTLIYGIAITRSTTVGYSYIFYNDKDGNSVSRLIQYDKGSAKSDPQIHRENVTIFLKSGEQVHQAFRVEDVELNNQPYEKYTLESLSVTSRDLSLTRKLTFSNGKLDTATDYNNDEHCVAACFYRLDGTLRAAVTFNPKTNQIVKRESHAASEGIREQINPRYLEMPVCPVDEH